MRNRKQLTRGFGLVEVVVGAAIVATTFVALASSFNIFVRAGLQNTAHIQAAYYAEEGLEAVRYLRDAGWRANIAVTAITTTHYLSFGGVWALSTTPSTVNGFTRTVVFNDVYRDNDTKDIVAAGGGSSLDGNARKVTVQVSWTGAPSPVRIETYLTNLFNN